MGDASVDARGGSPRLVPPLKREPLDGGPAEADLAVTDRLAADAPGNEALWMPMVSAASAPLMPIPCPPSSIRTRMGPAGKPRDGPVEPAGPRLQPSTTSSPTRSQPASVEDGALVEVLGQGPRVLLPLVGAQEQFDVLALVAMLRELLRSVSSVEACPTLAQVRAQGESGERFQKRKRGPGIHLHGLHRFGTGVYVVEKVRN